jgi:hypothetical protein
LREGFVNFVWDGLGVAILLIMPLE